MTIAILSLLGTVLGLVAWGIKRRAEKRGDPLEQHRRRYAEIDREIAQGTVTANPFGDLDELERLEKREEAMSGQAGKRVSEKTTLTHPLTHLLLICGAYLFSGCAARVHVIPADQVLERVPRGTTFVAPIDGWFMGDALYQRTRRAVADRILELQR